MLAALAMLAAAGAPAAAQNWPERPLTMVIPFAAGGAVDILGRILAARLGEVLGQRVIIENVGGAGGMSGAYRVAKATPTATSSRWAASPPTPKTSRSIRNRSTTPRSISRPWC
jgi:tripartite-type tricarboxylate transporter receptor subunit TctC